MEDVSAYINTLAQLNGHINPEQIKSSHSPFLASKQGESIFSSKKHTLNAVMMHRAKIDGRWYKLGENVGRYRLKKVNETYVELTYEHSMIKLYFKKDALDELVE